MTDFYEKQLKNFPSHNTQIIPSHIEDGLVSKQDAVTGNYTYRIDSSARVVAQHKVMVSVSPSTSVQSTLLNGGLIEFKIEKGAISGSLDHCWLALDVINSTGANSVIQPYQLCIDRWEVYGSNGATLLFQKTGMEMYLDNMHFSATEFEYIAGYLGLNHVDYTTAGINTIADGTAFRMYFPLVSFFTPLNLCLPGLQSELIVRIRFQPASLNFTSGAAITTTSAHLLLKGRALPDYILREKANNYMNLHHSLPYMGIQKQTQTMTLTQGSNYSILLNGIRGICSCLYFTIRASPITAANQVAFISASSFDLQASDGSSLIGSYRRLQGEMIIDFAETFDSRILKHKNINVISFSNKPTLCYTTGQNNGSICMTGNEKLSFTPNMNGAAQIDIYCATHELLYIENGIAKSTRS